MITDKGRRRMHPPGVGRESIANQLAISWLVSENKTLPRHPGMFMSRDPRVFGFAFIVQAVFDVRGLISTL